MEAGNQQKIELFGKSGHEEFRNNYEENRAEVRDGLETRVNVRNLGIPQEVKPKVWTRSWCNTTNSSLPCALPSSSWLLARITSAFSHFFQNMPNLSHLSVFAHVVLCAWNALVPAPILSHFHPSFGSQIKSHFFQETSPEPPVETRSPAYILSCVLHIFMLNTA